MTEVSNKGNYENKQNKSDLSSNENESYELHNMPSRVSKPKLMGKNI